MILTDQRAAMVGSFDDLAATYAALTGEPLPPMEIAAARTRVQMCMLANVNHQQHSGQPANAPPPPVRSLKALATAGVPLDMFALNPYKVGTLLRELKEESLTAQPCERRPQIVKAKDKPEGKHAPKGRRLGWQAVPGGVSRVGAASSRGIVLLAVKELSRDGEFATEDNISKVCALQPHFTGSVKQHLQKLLEVAHIAPVYAQQTEGEQP